MKNAILLMLTATLLSLKTFGQAMPDKRPARNDTITGYVIDGLVNNVPLPGVIISVNTKPVAATNTNGQYMINALPGDTIGFKALGYAQQWIKLKPKQKVLNAALGPGHWTTNPDAVHFTTTVSIYADKIKKGQEAIYGGVSINGGPKISADTTGKVSINVKKGDILLITGLACRPKTVKIRKQVDSLKVRLWVVIRTPDM